MVPTHGQGEQQQYSIQILRAVAACTVVYLHTFTAPVFGLFGVDLFFVISGYVMCMIVDSRNPRPAVFLMDRITRIVPLYWVVTTMLLVVAWVAPGLMGSTVADFGNYLLSLLFIPHFREDGQVFPLLMVGWSLNYEMVFYLIICVVLTIDRARYKWLLPVAVLAVYLSNVLLDETTATQQFLDNPHWLEFILGSLGYEIHRRGLVPHIHPALALLLVGVTYVSMVLMENKPAGRFFNAGVPSFFMLMLLLQLEGEIRRLQTGVLRLIVHIGDSSYATYLTHMFVIGFVERVVFARLGIEGNLGTALISMACCLVVGSLTYRFVDLPLTRWARVLGRRFVPTGPAPLAHGSRGSPPRP